MPRVCRPYIPIVPTYGGGHQAAAVSRQVIHSLNDLQNRFLIQGATASGGTNFGEHYYIAGPIIAQKYNVPILYRFELSGTPHDVQTVRDLSDDFQQKQLAVEKGTCMSYIDISVTLPRRRHNHSIRLRPIGQNNTIDEKGRGIWNRLTNNFRLPEEMPLSNDLPLWNQLSDMERSVTMRVFTDLTMSGTVQVTVDETSWIQDDITEHEQTTYTNIAFVQAVHIRSYSLIFSTLSNTPGTDAVYTRAINNSLLQERTKIVLQHYCGEDSSKCRVASTLLSSLLLYMDFCLPLYFSAYGILINTADMIRLILRDKTVHGYYSGYKYQRGSDLHPERVAEMEDFAFQLPNGFYELELKYSGEIYEPTNLMDDVAIFARCNTSKAIANPGYPTRFAPEETEIKADIPAVLAPGSEEAHNFSLDSDSSYVVNSAESISDEDWDF